jgi:hypothetical protein
MGNEKSVAEQTGVLGKAAGKWQDHQVQRKRWKWEGKVAKRVKRTWQLGSGPSRQWSGANRAGGLRLKGRGESSAKAALEPVVPAGSDRFRGEQKSRH